MTVFSSNCDNLQLFCHRSFLFFFPFFVIVDCHFIIISQFSISSLPDFCWLFVCFFFLLKLSFLVFSFALYFWWMSSHPWFLFTRFFFYFVTLDGGSFKLGVIKLFFILKCIVIGEGVLKLKVLKFSSILKHIVIIGKGFYKLCMLKK